MRVLVLCNLYPPHHQGGYELSCRDVVERLARRGHEVTVLTSTARVPGAPSAPEPGVQRSLQMYWDDHRLLSPGVLGRLAIERANQRSLRRALDRAAPDVVSVWNMGAMSLGLLSTLAARGIPLVLVVCDDWLVYGPRLDAWARLWPGRPRLGRLVARLTGAPTELPDLRGAVACYVSEFTRRRAEAEAHHRMRPATAAVVYSGVDRDAFPGPLGAPADPRPWGGNLLYVGRLDARKGIETLLAALARLQGTRLRLVGPGPEAYRAELARMAERLGVRDRLDIAGAVERHELAAVYSCADAVVFPPEWDEPFGLVPLEAMACGAPVVATGTGGSGEFLLDGVNCLLCPPADPAALAAALEALAADPGLRARLRAGGLRTAEQLDVDRLADILEAWHSAAARGLGHGQPAPRSLVLDQAG